MYFLSSMPCTNYFERVGSHSWRSLSWREFSLVPHIIISFIRESWRLSNSHLELNLFNSVTKSWRFWPACCPYVKNLWQRIISGFFCLFVCFFNGIHSMQVWTATRRHGVTRKRSTKRLKHTGNMFKKNLLLEGVCYF